ncbi:type II toxin-antitoxin system death-on-curing family toxin [Tuwongella immobilis]|uniref:Fido domain-containing protein n=1 Tax=Tuwongella immobilis TaxID=692036 RepID=A0A6C2YTV0_9BACT|nr:type II toxin-antitoxin system death-on-curing family toxin [Tuwongella immobilis]VIP04854.1 death-on-curing protein : Death-on-curing family protein OS=Pleurocapsa sp. PCC 7327 GN=Ple7327_4226 PE=4 SV=1: Fic [Tuwongella immobilis]VTS07068.1 death-on-curing protein : Death-on-curing family protein OS=Pleurocapsa sp. PCC 7327 GN=Ple7327_4226 PE=4 SV=1: Fic [Tuwongella immobilis]
MIGFLTRDQILELCQRVIAQSGGMLGLRDTHGLDSAVAQPMARFAGEDLYPTMLHKAAALGYSLILNHPFMDGNKRVGHAALEVMLILNGLELTASVAEQERMILKTASGDVGREAFTDWVTRWAKPLGTPQESSPEESLIESPMMCGFSSHEPIVLRTAGMQPDDSQSLAADSGADPAADHGADSGAVPLGPGIWGQEFSTPQVLAGYDDAEDVSRDGDASNTNDHANRDEPRPPGTDSSEAAG